MLAFIIGIFFASCVLPSILAADPYPVVFDDSAGFGRKFEGIGGISGGGATSKLLANYTKERRDEILDYLFKPNFGASLQILKVEIGGDVESTDGTEASHMHNSWEENYKRGYEWWLLQEAKKRNPDIKIYCLPWGFPGWLGNGTNNPYVNVKATADYVVRWINAAKTVYNVDVDYVGIWNEKKYSIKYIETLRSTLDDRGFKNVDIIAADGAWNKISKDIKKHAKLASAVHAIGAHYPGTKSPKVARSTGKPLWASEDYSTVNNNTGGGCWARILNQNYVNGLMTSTISWNLVASYYPHLPFSFDGLMNAVQPWSGNYEVRSPVWISAHTTQFTQPGWDYLKHNNGVAKLKYGGSHVALTNPKRDQLTIVIETMTHDHSICVRPKLPPYKVSKQDIEITLKGSFASITQMNVWYSKLGFDGEKTVLFEKQKPITFQGGKATLSLGLDEVYTLTTVDTGRKGSYSPPPSPQPFPLTYRDDFEAYEEFQEPFNIAPQIGSFEVRQRKNNKVLTQTVQQKPVTWCPAEKANKTLAIVGNYSWAEIYVQIDFEIPEVNGTNGIFVATRVNHGGCWKVADTEGLFLFVYTNNSHVISTDFEQKNVLHKGDFPRINGTRHTLSMMSADPYLDFYWDNHGFLQLTVPSSPKNGWVAFGTNDFGLCDFDNLKMMRPQDAPAFTRSFPKSARTKLVFSKESSLP